MRQVNLYIHTSFSGMKKQDGAGGYVLSTYTAKGEATLTNMKEILNATPNEAALIVLVDALKRINKSCELKIFTESEHIHAGITNWMQKWSENEWKNSKGNDIANKELWIEVFSGLSMHQYEVVCNERHEYSDWLFREVETKANAV